MEPLALSSCEVLDNWVTEWSSSVLEITKTVKGDRQVFSFNQILLWWFEYSGSYIPCSVLLDLQEILLENNPEGIVNSDSVFQAWVKLKIFAIWRERKDLLEGSLLRRDLDRLRCFGQRIFFLGLLFAYGFFTCFTFLYNLLFLFRAFLSCYWSFFRLFFFWFPFSLLLWHFFSYSS